MAVRGGCRPRVLEGVAPGGEAGAAVVVMMAGQEVRW